MRWRSAPGVPGGTVGRSPAWMAADTAASSGRWAKGGSPLRHCASRMARANTSEGAERRPPGAEASGAANDAASLPLTRCVCASAERPKSASLAMPPSQMSTLVGLTLPWTRWRRWRQLSAQATSAPIRKNAGVAPGSAVAEPSAAASCAGVPRRSASSEPCGASSRRSQICSVVLHTPRSSTMCGWRSERSAPSSACRPCAAPSSASGTCLTATGLPSQLPRRTIPYVPLPSSDD
mmetsp:Transcript_6252/g.19565  ORF Transcript_6252/g.19565 Transcript_6252/m.19565 type:complete len:236 (-) Transcript_6252:310-1017(-)